MSCLIRRTIVGLLPLLTGCLFTGPMWEDTNSPVMQPHHLVGIVESEGARAAVVEYGWHGGAVALRYLLLPIPADGRVVAAPDTQAVVTHDERWLSRLKQDPNFRPLERHVTTWVGPNRDGVRILHYWPHSTPPPPDREMRGDAPPGAVEVPVPPLLPRSQEQIRDSRRRAALMTPFTLIGDVLYTPVLIVACGVFGQCP
jgi:hypothetical protein